MCVHEHLREGLLCAGHEAGLRLWLAADLTPGAPWCDICYQMRPGGHHCTMQIVFTPLGRPGS